jgi:hypothetical protein
MKKKLLAQIILITSTALSACALESEETSSSTLPNEAISAIEAEVFNPPLGMWDPPPYIAVQEAKKVNTIPPMNEIWCVIIDPPATIPGIGEFRYVIVARQAYYWDAELLRGDYGYILDRLNQLGCAVR